MSRYVHPCWQTLGIEPTSDQRAIRVAYSAKLKAIDPETDPQAFIALREAFENARVQAQWVNLPDDDEDEDWGDEVEWDREPEGEYRYSPITGAATPVANAGADDKYRALADFLLPGGERRNAPLNDDEERELHALFDTALADPRMETIAFQADADRWFAETLARSWPASDAVLLRAARRFNWDAGAEPGTYLTPAVDFINARLRDGGSYGPVTDPAVGPATGWGRPQAGGSSLAAPTVETPEDRLADTIPSSGSRPEWHADPEPEGYRVREPISGGPRFDPPQDESGAHIPLPGGGPEWEPASSPWAPASAQDADAHARALAELVYAHADGETYASDEQKTAMLAHWEAIAADPRMQEIAYFADADRWFSELIARAIPFSDPLILPSTRFFGWTRTDGTITQSWAAEKVSRRFAAIEFMEVVQKPDHPLNKAWRELTTPAGERARRGRVDKRAVAKLLAVVRTHYPDLEGAFDFYRVGLWDGTVERSGSGVMSWIYGGIFLLLILVRVLGNIGDQDHRPPPVVAASQLSNQNADLDWALDRIFPNELNMSKITSDNPALGEELEKGWQLAAGDKVSRGSYLTDVEMTLQHWYTAGIRKGDGALLSDYHQLTIDTAKLLKSDPAKCAAFVRGEPLTGSFTRPPEMEKRGRALMIRTLLGTDGREAPDRKGKFSVPGNVMDAAAKRAGVPRADLQKAMLFEGSDSQQCTGRIAFMEAVLALPPKQRLPIMRVM